MLGPFNQVTSLIEAVFMRPKMYTFGDGTFGAAISFLEGYYSGKSGGYSAGMVAAGQEGKLGSGPPKIREWSEFREWSRLKLHQDSWEYSETFRAIHSDDATCCERMLELYREFRRDLGDRQDEPG